MSHDNADELRTDKKKTAPATGGATAAVTPEIETGEPATETSTQPQQVIPARHPESPETARSAVPWWRRSAPVGAWLAGIVAAVIAAVLAPLLLAQMERAEPEEPLPFTVAVVVAQDATTGWISDKPPSEVPVRPDYLGDWQKWAEAAGVVPWEHTTVMLTVQGRSVAQVTITDLKVRVVARRPAIAGTSFFIGGGGHPGIYRWIEVNLDTEPPTLASRVEEDLLLPEEQPERIRFPYLVSLTDAETFVVEAYTVDCDCDWVIELSWASQGQSGVLVIDDDGRPFRVSGRRNVQVNCGTPFEGAEQCGRA